MNTDVPGSPGSCRASADALGRLAHHFEQADRLTDHGARTPEHDFEGRTADAYRAACADLAANASAHARAARRAAGALASYAGDLAAVQRVMERVRASAGVHGLLQGTELVPPTAPTPHQIDVFDRLSSIAADAVAHLERARDRLGAAFPGQPFPADYGNVLFPPEEEPVGPSPFPPSESAWPIDRRDDEPRAAHPPRDDGAGLDRRAPEGAVPDAREDADDAGSDAPHRDPAPDPASRFHRGGPAGDAGDIGYGRSDRARLPGHVLRPAPEPVP